MKKPNVLVVMVDQMRSTALGCAGIEDVYTPNLDAFAASGTRFTRAVSNYPACSPARASFISGLHLLNHGLICNDKQLRTDLKSLAHCLNDEGYKCGNIGKWHMDCEDRGVFIPPGPRRQGFDDFWAAYNCHHQYNDAYYYLNDDPEPVWVDGYEPIVQTELAMDYISKKVEEDNPFFLLVSMGPPHCPYLTAPQKYLDMFPEDKIKLKPNAVETADKKIIAGYYAHIAALDDCFGRLMEHVDTLGIDKDTIIIFTSDHGDMLFSQNKGWKSKPWLESVGIPFLVRWPEKVPAGRVSDGLISLVDVMPTLLSLVGANIPKEVEGVDLSLLVLGDEEVSPESTFIGFATYAKGVSYTEWRGVMTKIYSYARFRDKGWILYNDREDPYQLNNLIDVPLYKGLQEEMEALLQKWLEKVNDPFESCLVVSAKYLNGFTDNPIKYYENDKIKLGRQERLKIQK